MRGGEGENRLGKGLEMDGRGGGEGAASYSDGS